VSPSPEAVSRVRGRGRRRHGPREAGSRLTVVARSEGGGVMVEGGGAAMTNSGAWMA
jgi:hypothetical protein